MLLNYDSTSCSMVATIEEIKSFLSNPGKIIVVGASIKTEKAGYYVPKYLQDIGFQIIPINPFTESILGEKTYKNLDEVPYTDIKGIIIYRSLPHAQKVALKAIEKKYPLIWLPEGITSEIAEKKAEENGILFVQDDCPLRRGKQLVKNII